MAPTSCNGNLGPEDLRAPDPHAANGGRHARKDRTQALHSPPSSEASAPILFALPWPNSLLGLLVTVTHGDDLPAVGLSREDECSARKLHAVLHSRPINQSEGGIQIKACADPNTFETFSVEVG